MSGFVHSMALIVPVTGGVCRMFTSKEHIEEKAALSGRGRLEYLQALVTEFQDTDSHGLLCLIGTFCSLRLLESLVIAH